MFERFRHLLFDPARFCHRRRHCRFDFLHLIKKGKHEIIRPDNGTYRPYILCPRREVSDFDKPCVMHIGSGFHTERQPHRLTKERYTNYIVPFLYHKTAIHTFWFMI